MYKPYLIHFNQNHDKKNGQFTFGDGDGDGQVGEGRKKWDSGDYKRFGKNLELAGKGATKTAGSVRSIAQNVKPKKNPRKDLSSMSDAELQKILNRERMELEYDRYFNSPQESKGKKFLENVALGLEIAGALATIAGVGYGIYSGERKHREDRAKEAYNRLQTS